MLRQKPRRVAPPRGRQRGVGLTEVMVAVLVVGIGVLGYAGMQLFALQSAENAGYRTHATMIGRDALERLLLNPQARSDYFDSGDWPTAPGASGGNYPAGCVGGGACQPTQLARADIAQLSWMAANSLPGGMVRASTACGGGISASCVVITWRGMTPAQCLNGYPDIPNTADYNCVVLEALRP
ncbi:MAG: type IV pilus modification protein PilV [Alcanivorax sp.]|nr:type IV pilus modification protein PilV [Alcanivorax sp.]